MIELKYGENTMFIAQSTEGSMEVDVVEPNGEVEYSFSISKEEFLNLINNYQKQNNII